MRTVICPGCQATVTTNHSQQRFCSAKCRRRHNYLSEYTPRRYTKQCRWCGKAFPSRNKAQLTCNKKCSQKWQANVNRDRVIARVNAWAAANPERFARRMAAGRARRRAVVANAHAALVTDRDLRRLKERQRNCCAYCGQRKALTLEHVVPLARGGAHSIGNLLWACRSCNCSKRQRLLIEWRYIRMCAERAA